MQTQEQVVEELYRDFRKRVERKLKTDIEGIRIQDLDGETVVEVIPRRVVAKFGEGKTPAEEVVGEPDESGEGETE